jgi:ribosomal protein S27AE
MTVICDKCGRSYFVARAVSRMGQLLRLSCTHCGQYLWTNTPRPRPRRAQQEPAWKALTRGFS